MRKTMIGAICAFVASFWVAANAEETTLVKIETSMGDMLVELYPDKAPLSVANFLEYAKSGHYDRTIIHRVVKGRIIQGGGYSRYFNERSLRDPVAYEGGNGLPNKRGALALARTGDPDSAQSQWFINLTDNQDLDHRQGNYGPIYGYAVFGQVIEGMDVADAIGDLETRSGGPFDAEVPVEAVIVNRIDRVASD